MTFDAGAGTVRRWSALPLRLIVGYGMLAHGYAKLANGPEHFAASLQALGVPAPHVMGWATTSSNSAAVSRFLRARGFRWSAFRSLPFWSSRRSPSHLPYGFSSIKLRAVTEAGPQFGPPGYETDLLYLAALAALVLGGSGPWSVDAAEFFSSGQLLPRSRRTSCPD